MAESTPPLDFRTGRAILLHVHAERAFGIDDYPAGARLRAPAPAAEAAATREVLPAPKHAASLAPDAIVARPPSEPPVLTLEVIAARVAACKACGLHETRLNVVPGEGPPRARLMFVGEAPGAREDQTGRPFVGPAGQLLARMIAAMGLAREEVFIANVLKCRPPGNRDPAPAEVDSCLHFLLDQIALVGPEVICTLGAHATRNLLNRDEPMSRLRGRVFPLEGRRVVPTYHPSYLLQKPQFKRDAWDDLKVVMRELGLGGADPSH